MLTRRDYLRNRNAPKPPPVIEKPNPHETSARIVEQFAAGKDAATVALLARIAFVIRHQPNNE